MPMPLPYELIAKYPRIPEEGIYDAIELATIRAMGEMHGKTVGAFFNGIELDVYLYSPAGTQKIDMTKLRRRNKRRLLDELEIELMKRDACLESREFHTIRGAVLAGAVERIEKNGDIIVKLEFIDVVKPTVLYAHYPVQQQPVTERGKYTIGVTLQFMIISCLPVSDGKRAMVRTVVSRVARELPSKLIADLTGLTGIRCTKRIPGGYSRILTKYPLPKTEVNKVGKELKEHLEVICPSNPKHPFLFSRRKS